VSLTVHEVNEYFTYPAGTLRDVTESLAKRLLHRRIQHYSFFLPAMAARFRERMPDAVAVFLPSRFYSASPPEEKAGEPFSIVVPGSVDPNRRDYAVIADVFRTWPATAPPVRLVLLGDGDTPDGRDVVARLRELESHRFQLRYYKGYVPESIYEAGIGQAGVLWSPLRVGKKGSRNTPETYGQTTASGLTADLLLSPAPALVPADLLLPESFRTALLPYASAEEAQALLLRLSGDGAFRRRLRREIHLAFTYFVKENFRTAFASLTALDQEGEKGADYPIKAKHQPVE
jgi:glycosyltransferase involved in cell wall biosynthesis